MKQLLNICLIAAMMLTSINAIAQDTQYKAKVKQLLISSSQLVNLNKPNEISTYAILAQQVDSTLTKKEAQKLTQEYMDTRLIDMFVDLFTPLYFENFTETELTNLINFYQTDNGKRLAECINKLNSVEVQTILADKIQDAIMAIAFGKEAPHVACAAPESFMQKFDQFNQYAQLNRKTDLIINALKSRTENSPEAIKVYDNLSKYLNTESRGIYGSMFYMAYTEDDMNLLIASCDTPERKKMIEMTNTISANTMEIGFAIVRDFKEWIKQHKNQQN